MDGQDGGGHGGGGHAGGHDLGQFGAPGSHGMGELHHGGEHGHTPHHGDKGGLGARGGKGHGSLTIIHSHHDFKYHSRWDFNHGANYGQPGGPIASQDAVDPIRDTVTLDQARITGSEATRAYMAYFPNHGYYDFRHALNRWRAELSARFFDTSSPLVTHGTGWWGETRARFRRLINKLLNRKKMLIRIDLKVPGLNGAEEHKKKLLAYHALTDNPTPENMPDGYLPGFDGETTVVKHVYQLSPWNSKYKSYEYDRLCNTWIEVVFVVWWFRQTGVYTTRFTVNVVSRKQYDVARGEYGVVREAFNEHQLVAQWLVKHLADDLKAAVPNAVQMDLLKRYGETVKRPNHEPGYGPAPIDIIKELEDANLAAAGMADADPRLSMPGVLVGPGGIGFDTSLGDNGTNNEPIPPNPWPSPGDNPPDSPDPGGIPTAEDQTGGDDSGMGSHPPFVPMGFASGSDLDNILPGSAGSKVSSKKTSKDASGIWQPSAPPAVTKVTVTINKK
jgi:hypothetical protein